MSNRHQEIKLLYDQLIHDSGSPGQRVRSRIDEGSPIKLWASCIFPHKNTMLEIGPLKNAWLPAGYRKPRIKGISVDFEKPEAGPNADFTLLLELQQPEALDVFVTFVARVCEDLDALDQPAAAVKAVIALIDRWKEFFSGSSEILSEPAQTGLYGELYLVNKLISAELPVANVVEAWTGSKRTNQDFEFGRASIEVKSTVAVDATNVNITNVRQLDDTGLERLFLARLILDARQGDEHTLPALIDQVRATLQKEAPEKYLMFEEKLIQADYQDKHATHYANRAYSERAIDIYQVDEEFPRLVEAALPTGITKVNYEVSLANCQQFKTDTDKTFAELRTYCD